MLQFKEKFDTYMGVKKTADAHENRLFERARKYTKILSYIPGIEMIAVVNSLSMFATHKNSDIDFFIIAKPEALWFVRFSSTLILWICGVWRHGREVPGNICLSFFLSSNALNLEEIRIQDDIYLFYWIYYMKPLYDAGGVYERFIIENTWFYREVPSFPLSTDFTNEVLLETNTKVYKKRNIPIFLRCLNFLIRYFLMPYSKASYIKKGKPEGVIISDTMLKFHDQDKRKEIRDAIFGK